MSFISGNQRRIGIRWQQLSEVDSEGEKPWRKFNESLGGKYFEKVWGWARFLLISLLPAWMQPDNEQPENSNIRQTSALDGLRGLAAIAVMNYHVLYVYQGFVFYGYGLSPQAAAHCARPEDIGIGQHNLWFHQLPILRLTYSGTAAVSIFFVISGFALSYKPLQLTRRRDFSASMMSVSSSTFRRGFRLIVPPATVSLVVMLAVWMGLYENGRRVTKDHSIITEIPEHHAQRMGSFFAQVLDWCHAMKGMINVFSWRDFHPAYDVHLWTISTELRCSLALFLILLVVVRMKTSLRYAFEGLAVVCMYLWGRWDLKLFFAGMLIADLSLRPSDGDTVPLLQSRFQHWARSVLKVFLLFISLYLLSAPDFCISATPGYKILGYLIPSFDTNPVRFWPGLGAMLLVSLIAFDSPTSFFLNRFLNHAVVQFSGKLSFSLYIVHGPILHTLGYWLWPVMWEITGKFTVLRYILGFAMAYVVYGVVLVWVSDLVWRGVDRQAVRVARLVEGACFVKDTEG